MALGVEFNVKPIEMGTVRIAVFNDTCGNNIQIVECPERTARNLQISILRYLIRWLVKN